MKKSIGGICRFHTDDKIWMCNHPKGYSCIKCLNAIGWKLKEKDLVGIGNLN